MIEISERFREALSRSHTRVTVVECTPPGEEPVEFDINPGAAIQGTLGLGIRTQVSPLTATPKPGSRLFQALSTEGAIFRIRHGIRFGHADEELITVFTGSAVQGGANLVGGDIQLSLVDPWAALEEARFSAPYSPPAGPRSTRIQGAVTGARPGTLFEILASGGSMAAGGVWDRSLTDFVKDLAVDGQLDVGFRPDGAFRIRRQPIISPEAVSWSFKTGDFGNITTAAREVPLDKLYNRVIVKPIDESQKWPVQIIDIADPDHPRHRDNIGRIVPFFHSSATLTSASVAFAAGRTLLQTLQGSTRITRLTGLGNPALEVGDIITVQHPSTAVDGGLGGAELVESFALRLDTGDMDVQSRSTSTVAVEEA